MSYRRILPIIVIAFVLPLFLASSNAAATASASPSLRSLARGSSSSDTLYIARPAGLAVGDVMIAVVAARLDGTKALNPPSGWTLVRRDSNAAGASLSQAVFYRAASALEPPSYKWSFSTATVSNGAILAYAGIDPVAPLDASSGTFVADSKTLVAQSVTTRRPGDFVLGFFANNSNRPLDPPSGTSERFDYQATSSVLTVESEGVDFVAAAAGATGDKVASVSRGGSASSSIGALVALVASGAAVSTTATPPPPPPPPPDPTISVSTASPSSGSTVGGSIRWEARTSGTIARVEFLVDGALRWTETSSPWVYNGDTGVLDTATLANGSHALAVRAWGTSGDPAASTVNVNVSNTTTPPPTTRIATSGLYSSDSPFNQLLPSGAEVDPGSSTMVQTLVSAASQQGFLVAAKSWTVPVYYADATTPKKTFSLTASWAPMRTMSGVPVPANAAPDPAGDGHMMIVDRSTGCEYDFWKTTKNADGSWTAQWGNALSSLGTGVYPYGLSARGSGFALGAGLIRADEMAAGQINHALVFSYNYPKSGGPVLPATESDGRNTIAGAIPEGARVQLDPSLNLDALGLTPWQKVVARALQQYGMFLGDAGGGIALYAQHPQSAGGVVYPWGDQTYAYLPNSLVDKLRVLKVPPQFTPRYDVVPNSCATMS